jgi:hypothetical protein
VDVNGLDIVGYPFSSNPFTSLGLTWSEKVSWLVEASTTRSNERRQAVNVDAIEESITSKLFTMKELRNNAKRRRLASCLWGCRYLAFGSSPSNEGNEKIVVFTKESRKVSNQNLQLLPREFWNTLLSSGRKKLFCSRPEDLNSWLPSSAT